MGEVASLLGRYPGIGPLRSLTWHSPRPFSAAALALTESGPVFVKRHHRLVRDVAGLAEEHLFIAHLSRQGAPVVSVLAARDGQTAITLGDWTYEVHRQGIGVDLYRDARSWSPFTGLTHATAAGEALARLHLAAEGYDAPPRVGRPLIAGFAVSGSEDPVRAVEHLIAATPDLAAFMELRPWRRDFARVLMPFYEQLIPCLAGLRPLWTHNDWHASNLLWSKPGHDATVTEIFDFGLSDRTTAVYDLATAIERNAIEWLMIEDATRDPVHLDMIERLLDGYQAVRPLDTAEATALPLLLPVVHVDFALSEIAYFNGILAAPDKAALAYDDYLLGHAEWFAGPVGQTLLGDLASMLGHRREAVDVAL
jgi:Ser/Thr protein kinase RdoA (MazF antagonist)